MPGFFSFMYYNIVLARTLEDCCLVSSRFLLYPSLSQTIPHRSPQSRAGATSLPWCGAHTILAVVLAKAASKANPASQALERHQLPDKAYN